MSVMSLGGLTAEATASSSERVLRVLNTSQDSAELLAAMKKVPAMLASGTADPETLASPLVRLSASHSAEVKKRVCEFLVSPDFASIENLGLLMLNTLKGDLADPNPAVRAVAVATICSLPDLAEQQAAKAIDLALKDSNPAVRKSGVTGCGKLFFHSPGVVDAHGLVDILYRQLKDPDPTVLTFTLQTLNVILRDEGGVVINNNMVKYFLQRLSDLPDLELCFLFEYLQRYYCPRSESSEERKMQLLNALDPYLESKKGPVFLAAADLFHSCTKSMEEDKVYTLLQQFMIKIRPQLAKFLKSSSNQDFLLQLLNFVLGTDKGSLLSAKDLYFKQKDISAVKIMKVKAMCHVCQEEDAAAVGVLQYLMEQLRVQEDAEVTEEILGAACSVAKNQESLLMARLTEMLKEDPRRYSRPLLRKVRLLPKANRDSFVLCQLCRFFLTTKEEPRGFLWVLSNSRDLEEAPYYLEQAMTTMEEELWTEQLLQPLLLAAVRVFARHPAATQHTLGDVFELCMRKGSLEVTQRVEFYSRLLQNSELVEKVLL